ncbi:MAG: histidinol-phosphate aminotransferase [Arenicella sp.]|jgi:histidinol-phosphate aminotransferase
MSRFWSDIVSQLTPYTPGEQPQISNLIKLNTNENPYGPSPKVTAAIAAANNNDLRKYPDPNAATLKATIAKHFKLDDSMVFVGNSSDEVLAHVFRGLLKQSKPLLFPDITYSFYPVYCKLFEINYSLVPLNEGFCIQVDDYKLANGGIIFANPNAPTGIALEIDKVEILLQRNPDSVVVVDEAYVDFANDSAVRLIENYDNLLVTQTLSKSRSLAGLRVGVALGHAALIEGLERIKNSFHPYTLDALAIAGATAAFADHEYLEETCAKVAATRERTTTGLSSLGFEVLPSSANFVFAKHSKHNAETLFLALRKRDIIVRYFDKPRIKEFLRISIGTDDEMNSLLAALSEITSD